jgi:hypothetical protein
MGKKGASIALAGIPARTRLGALALAAIAVSGCFTEIGNPGKELTVSARFRIDYTQARQSVPKASAEVRSAIDSLRILQFSLNVVEVNYTALDSTQGRIWKLPDSLGKPVDFTGTDPGAVLPPVAVPPASYSILKLENRIPAHTPVDPDTLDFGRFSGREYIKGIAYYPGKQIRFLCQFTDDYKINLVYSRDTLERWRDGDTYAFDFVFYANRWLSATDLTAIAPVSGADGSLLLIDQEHNPDLFATLRSSFFKSFNSSKVWKENPAP